MAEQEPIKVAANAGLIDSLQAIGRYLLVLAGFYTALAAFVRVRDFAGFVAYVQANGGQIVGAVAGLIAAGTAAYGVIKTWKRGAQVATVAADPEVPDHVATLK